MKGKIYLLDFMALLYRAHFAFISRPIRTSDGFNTSAIYGFLLTLLEILEKEQPTHIAVAIDSDKPTPRHQLFPNYKANRDQMPEELRQAISPALEFVHAFNIPVFRAEGYEADDVIGTVATRAVNAGFQSFMVTPDKDFGQLVTDKNLLWRPGRRGTEHEILGPREICQQWEIHRPEQVVDVLALMGDPTDNIPGIPGIGPKTASALVREYGSLEEVLAHANEIPGRTGELLRQYAEQARLSKKLATILTDVPIETKWDSLKRAMPHESELRKLCERFEFRSIIRRIFREEGQRPLVQVSLFDGDRFILSPNRELHRPTKLTATAESGPASTQSQIKTIQQVRHSYQLIKSDKDLALLLDKLQAADVFCFDTETDQIDPHKASLLGISIAIEPTKAWYLPQGPHAGDNGLAKLALERLIPSFLDKRKLKIGHNLKFDLIVLRNLGIRVEGPFFDTMIAHALIEPEQRHGMDELAEKYLGYRPISIESLIGNGGKDQLSLLNVPVEQVAEYSAEDADVTLQLFYALKPLLVKHNLERVFYEVEMPVLPAIAEIEFEGIQIEPAELEQFGRVLEERMRILEQQIQELAGVRFNINSSQQLGEVLYERLKLDSRPRKTATGRYATDAATLERLVHKHPIVAYLLEYREMAKLKSTYVDGLINSINPKTGRVHTTFHQAATATGRLSSQNPNLQNIPIRTELGQQIRKAFVARKSPDEDWLLMSADYSQIELRVVAALSGEAAMIEAFQKGLDIHAATASRIFGVPPAQVTPEQRRQAKTVNFGIIYGMSAQGLAERLGISRTEAKKLIDQYFATYPSIKAFIEKTIQFARENGFVQTVTGRRRYLPDINSANSTVRGAAERNAINTPIQGTAADMIKIAMAKIYEEIHRLSLRSRMILQIHDELLFDVPICERQQVAELVERCMKSALPLGVPIDVTIGFGKNWLEAHA